jgi:hypothetical protein
MSGWRPASLSHGPSSSQEGVVMVFDPVRVSELIDRLANSLQRIVLLAEQLEPDLKQSARDAADLLRPRSRGPHSTNFVVGPIAHDAVSWRALR